MVEPKTIDNLGINTSIRWAQDQEYLDKKFIKESPFVSRQTTMDVSSPSFSSEFDTLFQINKRFAPWAFLLSPSGYNHQNMRLFTFQTIPSLGSDEFLAAQMQKIKDKVDISKEARSKRRKEGLGSEYPWEDEREEEEELKQSKNLIALFEYLLLLDTLMVQINARRNQYQKG